MTEFTIKNTTFEYDIDLHTIIESDEITHIRVRLYEVTDEGAPYVYADVEAFGYQLTQKGKRRQNSGYKTVYPEKTTLTGFNHYEPTAYTKNVVAPIIKHLLALHPEWAGLEVNGIGGYAVTA